MALVLPGVSCSEAFFRVLAFGLDFVPGFTFGVRLRSTSSRLSGIEKILEGRHGFGVGGGDAHTLLQPDQLGGAGQEEQERLRGKPPQVDPLWSEVRMKHLQLESADSFGHLGDHLFDGRASDSRGEKLRRERGNGFVLAVVPEHPQRFVGVLTQGLSQPFDVLFRASSDDGNEQLILAGEVVLEQSRGDAGSCGDGAVGHAGIALLDHEPFDTIEQQVPRLRCL